ncbi:MAG: cache domain-containing protein [Lachnospiraceae bacterium]|nr:cache domain-containing protein [Lachnospiraceae bacterium]
MRHKIKSIKAKYLIIGFTLCTCVLVPISFFSYMVAQHITVDLSNKMIREKTARTANEIDYWFESRQKFIEDLAEDIEIYGDFSDKKLEELLKSKRVKYGEGTVDLFIGFNDSEGAVVNASQWKASEDYEVTKRIWYKQAVKTDKVIFTEPYVDAMTGELVIAVAKALRHDGEIVGVLGSDIYLTEIMKEVESAKISENSYGMLLDANGGIISHPNPDFQPTEEGVKNPEDIHWEEYKNLLNSIFNLGELENIAVKDNLGKTEIFNFSKISSNQWYIGIGVNEAEYREPLKGLLIGFCGAISISVLLSLFIMFKLIKNMVEPIKSLNDTVRAFSLDTGARVNISSEDEIGELGRNFNEMADTIQKYGQSLEKMVTERTEELQNKNNTIMESIEYARRLQNAIIPDISKKFCILKDNNFAIWRPRDIVGGDIYWCRGNADFGLIVLADCTGHGVPGALMSMALNSILDTSIHQEMYNNPAKMMDIIYESLEEVLGQNETDSEIKDGADIGILYVDKTNKKILFCGANLHLFVAYSKEIQMIKGDRDSGNEVNYQNIEIPFEENMVCYLTSDGFLDQNKEENTGGIGRRGFISLIRKIHLLPMQEQKDFFEANIEEKLGFVSQRDDITIIGLKVQENI